MFSSITNNIFKKSNTENYVLLFFILLATFLYSILILRFNLVVIDEPFSLAMFRKSYAEIWNLTAQDVHPPLYYFILKFLTQPFGYNEIFSRICSSLFYIFCIIFYFFNIKNIFSLKIAIYFTLCFIFSPFLIQYAAQIRMYSLITLSISVCAISAYNSFSRNKKRDWIILTVSFLVSAYSHYYAFLSVIIIALILLVALLKTKKDTRYWLISFFIIFILYLPWLSTFINQLKYKVEHPYWIPNFDISTLMFFWNSMFNFRSSNNFIFVITPIIIICLFFAFKDFSKDKNKWLLIAISLVPFLIFLCGITCSILIRPVFVIRYAIETFPFILLLISIGISKIDNNFLSFLCISILVFSGVNQYLDFYIFGSYRQTALINPKTLSELKDIDAYIVVDPDRKYANSISYYNPDKSIYVPFEFNPSGPITNFNKLDNFNENEIKEAIIVTPSKENIPHFLFDSYTISFVNNICEQYVSPPGDEIYFISRKTP